MSEASVPDHSGSIFDRLVALDGDEARNVNTDDPVDHWYRLGLHHAYRQPVLEWMGPVAFARTYGAVPGIEHGFGTCWGSNGDQRVSLRVRTGGDAGLLYVHDSTWDEYAVLGSDIPLAAVPDACAGSPQLGEHPSVEDLVALLPNRPPSRPSPGPKL
ncbi:MAG TPA: hypothetical protein VIJ07_17895 [Dermatophilaceae bacterium]